MAQHFYFVPMIRSGDQRGPKYISWDSSTPGITCRWSIIDYGHIDLAFLAADTALVDHQSLFDQPDVLSIDPRTGVTRDLEQNATTGEIDALTAYLDNAGNFCPMGWATTSDTRRSILRGVCGMFLFLQNVTGILQGGTPKDWGINLSTTWSELTAEQQGVLLQAASNLGYSTAAPGPTVTMRAILRFMGIAWGDKPIYMGQVVL